MGGALSVNVGEQTAVALIDDTNTATQICQTSVEQIQVQTVSCGGTGTTCNITNDWDQYLNIDSQCLQSTTFQNDLTTELSQSAQQTAESATNAFNLSSSDSKNYYEGTAVMATVISNTFVQDCNGYGTQIQAQMITATGGATVNAYNNWDQYNQSMYSCVSDNSAVNSVSQRISQSLDQQAQATVRSFFAILLGILIVVFGVIILIVLGFFLLELIKKPKAEAPQAETLEET